MSQKNITSLFRFFLLVMLVYDKCWTILLKTGHQTNLSMTKSELINSIAARQNQLSYRDIELAVNTMIDTLSDALVEHKRIEIRGFGSFTLHYRPPRIGRNPKTGEKVKVSARSVVHFKPGKELRERVDRGSVGIRTEG